MFRMLFTEVCKYAGHVGTMISASLEVEQLFVQGVINGKCSMGRFEFVYDWVEGIEVELVFIFCLLKRLVVLSCVFLGYYGLNYFYQRNQYEECAKDNS